MTSSGPKVARRFQDFGLSRSSLGDDQNPELCGYPTMAQLRVSKLLGLGPQVERRLGLGSTLNPKPLKVYGLGFGDQGSEGVGFASFKTTFPGQQSPTYRRLPDLKAQSSGSSGFRV